MTNVEIRCASPHDAAAVLACLAAAFEPYRASYTDGAYRDTVPTVEGVKQRMARMSVLVAQQRDGAIVGTLGFSVAGDEGHLRGMAVLPAHAGRDIATQLLRAAEGELLASGCTHITLDTTAPLQRAIRFYTRHGYAPTGTVTDFHGMALHEYRKNLREPS